MRRKPAKNRLPQISTCPVKTQTCTLRTVSLSRHVCVPGNFFPVKTQTCTSPPFSLSRHICVRRGLPSCGACQDTFVYFLHASALSRHICVPAAISPVKTRLCTCGDFPVSPVKTRSCTFCTAPLCQASFAACIKVKQKVPLPHSHAIRAPCLVRKMGLEPTRHGHTHLKRACLPIPALPQITGRTSVANGILAQMPAKCKGFCKKSFVEQVVGKDSAKKPPHFPKKQQRNGCNPAPFCYNGRWISHAAGGRIFPPGQEEYKTL